MYGTCFKQVYLCFLVKNPTLKTQSRPSNCHLFHKMMQFILTKEINYSKETPKNSYSLVKHDKTKYQSEFSVKDVTLYVTSFYVVSKHLAKTNICSSNGTRNSMYQVILKYAYYFKSLHQTKRSMVL